ncbi:hypothetical protein L7F22_027733 [Adiantum nelumboides]|nr:hypothetical protein [Adiantum nelumboides]
MEPVAAITEQSQSANTNNSGYNGRGRGAVTEVKQPEPVLVRAITRSFGVVIEELPLEEPTSSKLNPKAKEWEQHRSTWKEKGKAKEFDESKEQREVAAKITKDLSKRKPEIPECSEARTVERTPLLIAEALLLETQTVGTGSIPVDSSNDNSDSEKEQDEIEEKMGITNFKPAPFRVRMADQRIVQPSGLLENLHIKPWLRSAKAVQDYANQVITIQGSQNRIQIKTNNTRKWKTALRPEELCKKYGNKRMEKMLASLNIFPVADIDLILVLLDKQKAEEQREQFPKSSSKVMKERDQNSVSISQDSVMATRRPSSGNDGTKTEQDLHYHNEETDFDLGHRDTEAVLFDTSARSSRRRTTERGQRRAHQSKRSRREDEDFTDISRKSKLGRYGSTKAKHEDF